jgi:ABC transporter substrate binding protein
MHEATGISGYPRQCGGAAAWPVASKAQQAERVRLVGMLTVLGSDDPEGQTRMAVFEQTLQQLGWMIGRDLKIEIRQIGRDVDSLRRYAAELVALAPDVIFSIGSTTVASLQQATRTIPIVFINVPDPVGAGFVESMAPPRRQYHRLLEFRVQHERQMGRVAQANRAQRDPSLGVS